MKKLQRVSPDALKGNPRATYAAWQKYEPIVKEAYSLHPKGYTFKPYNMSPATVASRLRDAVRGAIAFEFSSSIDVQDLARWFDEVIVSHTTEEVYIGPKVKVKNVDVILETPDDPVRPHFPETTFRAYATLINSGEQMSLTFAPPIGYNPLAVALEFPNVSVMLNKQGNYVMF